MLQLRRLILASLLLLLSSTYTLFAQAWQVLGRTQEEQSSLRTEQSNMVLSPDGIPYIIVHEPDFGGQTIVRRFISDKWEQVGETLVAGYGTSSLNLVFSPKGELYAVFCTNLISSGIMEVRKLWNGKWLKVGTPTDTNGYFPSLTFNADGTPYLALIENGLVVKKFSGGSWHLVGTKRQEFISTGFSESYKLLHYKDEFYLAYADKSQSKCVVKKLVDGTWKQIGQGALSHGTPLSIDLAVDHHGSIHVAFADAGLGSKVNVKKLSDDRWISVGDESISSGKAEQINLLFKKDDTPIIFYNDITQDNIPVFGSFSGGKWSLTEITQQASKYTTAQNKMCISADDQLYISYVDHLLGSRLSLRTLKDGSWQGLGIDGVSQAASSAIKLRIDSKGIPYVAYQDLDDRKRVLVKKFLDGNWQTLAQETFFGGLSRVMDFALGPDDTPYIFYNDEKWLLHIKRYDGQRWVEIELNTFNSQGFEAKMAFSEKGELYIAYTLQSISYLKKRVDDRWVDISLWENPASVYHLDLAISKAGAVYLATDESLSSGVLRKYDQGRWQAMAKGVAFKEGVEISGMKLLISDQEIPYIAYADQAANVQVKRLLGEEWVNVGKFAIPAPGRPSMVLSPQSELIVLHASGQSGNEVLVSALKGEVLSPLTARFLANVRTNDAELRYDQSGQLYTAYGVPQAMVAKLVPDFQLPPKILTFSPSIVTNGTKVTITGENFLKTQELKFGDHQSASFEVISSTTVVGTVAEGGNGVLSLTTPSGTSKKDGLVFVAEPPSINSISTNYSKAGTTVSISGKNFSPVAAANIAYIGPVRAEVIAATAQTLSLRVPENGASGRVSVTVNEATAYSSRPFYLEPNTGPFEINAENFLKRSDYITEEQPRVIKLADIDGDGKPDVIVCNYGAESFSVFLNRSTPNQISLAPKLNIGIGLMVEDFQVVDADGDGKLDLLFSSINGATFVRNTSSPGKVSFADKIDYGNHYTTFVKSADLDRDGRPDMMISASQVVKFQFRRNVQFSDDYLYLEPGIANAPGNGDGHSLADLNNDGYPDIVSVELDGLAVHQNLSTPGRIEFQAPSRKPPFRQLRVPEIQTEDFDGDGKVDLLLINDLDPSFEIHRNISSGPEIIFSPAHLFPIGKVPFSFQLADFNGDGKPDVALSDIASKRVTLYFNRSKPGEIALDSAFSLSVAAHPVRLAAGDLDGDGRAELLVSNMNANSFTIFSHSMEEVALPSNNFQLSITGNACIGQNSGSIKIRAERSMDYQAKLVSGEQAREIQFSKEAEFEKLPSGKYTLQVYPKDRPEDFRNYELSISEPAQLSVYSSVQADKDQLSLEMTGGESYQIILNGKTYLTRASSIQLPLIIGSNTLKVQTGKDCQGVYEKVISHGEVLKIYPNPFEHLLNIQLGRRHYELLDLELYNSMGSRVFRKEYRKVSGEISLDLDHRQIGPGVYLLRMNADGEKSTHKVLKK